MTATKVIAGGVRNSAGCFEKAATGPHRGRTLDGFEQFVVGDSELSGFRNVSRCAGLAGIKVADGDVDEFNRFIIE